MLVLALCEDKTLTVLIDAHRCSYTDTLAAATISVQAHETSLAVRVLGARWCAAGAVLEANAGSGDIGSAVAVVLFVAGAFLVFVTGTWVAAAEGVLFAGVTVVGDAVAVAVGSLVCSAIVDDLTRGGIRILPLLGVHSTVLSLGLVVLVDDEGVEEATWRNRVSLCLSSTCEIISFKAIHAMGWVSSQAAAQRAVSKGLPSFQYWLPM